ncbi:formate dehydrogenase subunit alpha [Metallosphaera tengchongensis]|uniref:Formate dehydrogenase subunit alpha n=1 Tax=Metallosphaera tengchongensis TaxID=1532350 RepID=A0A6N0NY42_9CREN|nr:formate dehydrogenase subunit alpha [Metallosphaera tengchongensis]QKR00783.1 formate dehydrogenase subunit alpha [Metallosphaera tengchongensis]
MKVVKSICPFCGVGCGVELFAEGQFISRISPLQEHVLSRGHLCGKGTLSHEPQYSWDRLIYPLKRVRDDFYRISWEEAITEIYLKLKEVISRYGPGAVAFYGGCQNTLEEVYSMQKLARALGTNNVDSCARVCHEPSALSLKEMVGIGASSISASKIPEMRVVVIAGESLTESHPVLSQYLTQAKINGTKLVVVDPRVTGTSKLSDLHLRLRPGTDVALYNSVGNYLIQHGLFDQQFVEERTSGFDDYSRGVSKYTLEYAERVTGLNRDQIVKFAELIAGKGVIFSWGLGLTQTSGARGVMSYVDLALLTGNVGEAGGVLVFRGQTNVQGSGDLAKPNVFPIGDMTEENAEKLKEVWGFKPPVEPGLTVTQALLRDSKVRAVVLLGFNPAFSMPNRRAVERRLMELDLLVVLDPFMTQTAKFAHYVLPTAVWSEKEGSVSDLDRLVKWRFKAVDPPGEAKGDLEVLAMLGEKFNVKLDADPERVFREMRSVTPIYSGLELDKVKDYSSNSRYPNGEISLYGQGFKTRDGRARFKFYDQGEVKGGLVLITVRNVTRYNTDVWTGRMPGYGGYESSILLNPSDAKGRGIADGDTVKVKSECGEQVFKVRVSQEVTPGTAVTYFHDGKVNYVVCDELDDLSFTPKYKFTSIEVEKVERNPT